MFFSKIYGLWKEGNYIFISAEYHNAKFHINEIERVQIEDQNGLEHTRDMLPVRNARILFVLKSGRKRSCYVRKLTVGKYKYLTELLKTRQI